VSPDQPLDLARVPGTRLGLVVVGSLARKHKLQVYFRPSSRGGTGVVLRIPNQLVIHPREESVSTPKATETVTAAAGGEATATTATATAVMDPEPATETITEMPANNALPKRPRGQTLAAATRATGTPPHSPQTPQSNGKRADMGARFSAFQQGRRPTTPDETGPAAAGEEGSR
jgi:hypothetical protein